jgi:purine-binding chemotaxis protein CheW
LSVLGAMFEIATEATKAHPQTWLLCRVGVRLCALPLDRIGETMRTLPVVRAGDAPRFVAGMCIIRGIPVPVVEVAALFGDADRTPQRLVTLDAGTGRVALAVDAVLDVCEIAPEPPDGLPPLLSQAAGDAVAALRVLDRELLLLLDAARLVPEAALERLRATETPA